MIRDKQLEKDKAEEESRRLFTDTLSEVANASFARNLAAGKLDSKLKNALTDARGSLRMSGPPSHVKTLNVTFNIPWWILLFWFAACFFSILSMWWSISWFG